MVISLNCNCCHAGLDPESAAQGCANAAERMDARERPVKLLITPNSYNDYSALPGGPIFFVCPKKIGEKKGHSTTLACGSPVRFPRSGRRRQHIRVLTAPARHPDFAR